MDIKAVVETLEAFKIEESQELEPEALSLLEILFSTESVADALKRLEEIENPIELFNNFVQSINRLVNDDGIEYLKRVITSITSCPPSPCMEACLL